MPNKLLKQGSTSYCLHCCNNNMWKINHENLYHYLLKQAGPTSVHMVPNKKHDVWVSVCACESMSV